MRIGCLRGRETLGDTAIPAGNRDNTYAIDWLDDERLADDKRNRKRHTTKYQKIGKERLRRSKRSGMTVVGQGEGD